MLCCSIRRSSTCGSRFVRMASRVRARRVIRGMEAQPKSLMRSWVRFPNTTVRLGPGVFETKGFALDLGGWQPKSGQKIIGSGMGLTTLKIVGATVANKGYYALGNNINTSDPSSNLDYFEASDFTIDCNLGGQPVPMGYDFAPVACGAVSIRGSHIRFRRIRAINWGTQINAECFAMITGWAHPVVPEIVDCVIEDCLLEQPSANNTTLTTIIGIGSYESDGGDYSYPRACVIRNCLIDCDYVNNPVGISGISNSGWVATVTTPIPHNRN